MNLLAVVHTDSAERFHAELDSFAEFEVVLSTDKNDAVAIMGEDNRRLDVIVVDEQLGDSNNFINYIRHKYPRVIIILVDEEADFGFPGQADDISVDPFSNDDLLNRIRKLLSDRRMETHRSDSLPAVRSIAKQLNKATSNSDLYRVATDALVDQGYDYAAYYGLEADDPVHLTLRTQTGPTPSNPLRPKKLQATTSWAGSPATDKAASPRQTIHPTIPW